MAERNTQDTAHSTGHRSVILDIESDGLLDTVSKIWCIVCKDINTNEIFKFVPKTPLSGHVDWQDEFAEFVKQCDRFIGHNIVAYDTVVIERLLGIHIPINQIVDTLVMSRLFRPVSPYKELALQMKGDNRIGGHSLAAWGTRLGFNKIDFHDFSRFTEEMLIYCVGDVNLTHLVYRTLMKEAAGFLPTCIKLEHQTQMLLAKQERDGFYLDTVAAQKMVDDTEVLITNMEKQLRELFPPIPVLYKNYVPKLKKDGTVSRLTIRIVDEYSNNPMDKRIESLPDGSYNLFRMEEFNPGSGDQVIKRLKSIGWIPKKFTDAGKPRTDKDTISQALGELLDYPAVKYLSEYGIVTDRNQKAKKWLELVWGDGRVHGKINPIGAGTHRCSHYDDNMANIARVSTGRFTIDEFRNCCGDPKTYARFDEVVGLEARFLKATDKEVEVAYTGLKGAYGWDSRACWTVADKKNRVLVGVDASGIQLRALAHYMNDPLYTKNLLEGDIHEVHRQAAGISTRAKAKTFIYAWLLGAGDEKVGTIVGVEEAEYADLSVWIGGNKEIKKVIARINKEGGRADERTVFTRIKGAKVKRQFLDRTPALKRLKEEEIPRATGQGYLVGLDGRRFWIPSQHLAMSMYLQGFEAVIMKASMCLYQTELNKLGVDFMQCAFVHDEFQIETDKDCGDLVGRTVVDAIKKAGTMFNSNCPLDGEYRVGSNWAETH